MVTCDNKITICQVPDTVSINMHPMSGAFQSPFLYKDNPWEMEIGCQLCGDSETGLLYKTIHDLCAGQLFFGVNLIVILYLSNLCVQTIGDSMSATKSGVRFELRIGTICKPGHHNKFKPGSTFLIPAASGLGGRASSESSGSGRTMISVRYIFPCFMLQYP